MPRRTHSLHDTSLSSGPGQVELSVRVAQLRHGSGRDVERQRALAVLRTEQRHCRVDLAHAAQDRAGHWIEEGRGVARHARKRGTAYGRSALRYADDHRSSALLGLAAVAFAVGWLSRSRD